MEVAFPVKAAFAVDGPGPDALVQDRFGRAAMFTILDLESGQEEVINGPGVGAGGGAGVATAQALAERGVSAVVAGNLGPNAAAVLRASGILCYAAHGMTVSEAARLLQQGCLEKADGPTVSGHFGLSSETGAGPAAGGRPGSGTAEGTAPGLRVGWGGSTGRGGGISSGGGVGRSGSLGSAGGIGRGGAGRGGMGRGGGKRGGRQQ
jgi:predicted Fe-Mo cluster-binding NifX family protein